MEFTVPRRCDTAKSIILRKALHFHLKSLVMLLSLNSQASRSPRPSSPHPSSRLLNFPNHKKLENVSQPITQDIKYPLLLQITSNLYKSFNTPSRTPYIVGAFASSLVLPHFRQARGSIPIGWANWFSPHLWHLERRTCWYFFAWLIGSFGSFKSMLEMWRM